MSVLFNSFSGTYFTNQSCWPQVHIAVLAEVAHLVEKLVKLLAWSLIFVGLKLQEASTCRLFTSWSVRSSVPMNILQLWGLTDSCKVCFGHTTVFGVFTSQCQVLLNLWYILLHSRKKEVCRGHEQVAYHTNILFSLNFETWTDVMESRMLATRGHIILRSIQTEKFFQDVQTLQTWNPLNKWLNVIEKQDWTKTCGRWACSATRHFADFPWGSHMISPFLLRVLTDCFRSEEPGQFTCSFIAHDTLSPTVLA